MIIVVMMKVLIWYAQGGELPGCCSLKDSESCILKETVVDC